MLNPPVWIVSIIQADLSPADHTIFHPTRDQVNKVFLEFISEIHNVNPSERNKEPHPVCYHATCRSAAIFSSPVI